MIEKDPNDSVHNEQFAASVDAGENTEIPSMQINESVQQLSDEESQEFPSGPEAEQETNQKPENEKLKSENEDFDVSKIIPVSDVINIQEFDLIENVEDIELPPVDYSGYSKSELIETLELIVEDRPPNEIKDDVERIKGLFNKKIKQEAEERKKKFLEGGGKIEDTEFMLILSNSD